MSKKLPREAAAALAFLSRFPVAPALADPPNPLWFGCAGLLVSASALLPSFFVFLLPGMESVPAYAASLLAALFWLGLEALITGAMHWDGLADLADALGSGARGKRFQSILADSRIGAYGTLTIFIVAQLQILAAACYFLPYAACREINPQTMTPICLLALSGLWSRLCPVFLALFSFPAEGSRLGAMLCSKSAGCGWPIFFQSVLCLILAAFCGAGALVCALAIAQVFLVRYLLGKARDNGGISGDYMGAGLIASQSLFLLILLP